MDIQHVKGKENQVADALSGKLHGIYALYYNQLESQLLEQLKEEAQKDPEYKFLWQQMRMIRSKARHQSMERTKIRC